MTFTYSATTITVGSGIILPATIPNVEHKQVLGEYEDGSPYVYDHAVNVYFYECRVRCTVQQKRDLFSFIKNTIQFSKLAFTVTPEGTVDLGRDAGNALTAVRYWSNNLPVEIQKSGAYFVFSFLLRAYATGTSYPAGSGSPTYS